MKITVEGEHSEILSLKKELAAILRAESAGNPVRAECPICGEGNCTGGEECEGPGWASGVVDDLKDQIRSLESRNQQLSEDLTTWKAAVANNYELYQRTVKEAGAERDRLAEEVKRHKAPEGYAWGGKAWLTIEEFKALEACRDACVLWMKFCKLSQVGAPSHDVYRALWDAAEPFMTGESFTSTHGTVEVTTSGGSEGLPPAKPLRGQGLRGGQTGESFIE